MDLETHGFNGGELVVGTGWQEVAGGSVWFLGTIITLCFQKFGVSDH